LKIKYFYIKYKNKKGLINGGNMKKLTGLDWIAVVLLIIGGLNWGLIGIFRFDLIAALFGYMSWFTRIIYTLAGIAGIYVIAILFNQPSSKKK